MKQPRKRRQKFYVDKGSVEIVSDLIYIMGEDGSQLRVVKYTDYTKEIVESLFSSTDEFKAKWTEKEERSIIIKALSEKGITLDQLADVTKQKKADAFDLLCHVAFEKPILTRNERAKNVKKQMIEKFEGYSQIAQEILDILLDKYIKYGITQLDDLNILKVSPISKYGNVVEIASIFGGTKNLINAINLLQTLIYSD